MKKLFLLILSLMFTISLSSCDFIDRQAGTIGLESKSYEVTKEQYEFLIEKFNFSSLSNYLMFDNYDNYISFFCNISNENIDASDKEGSINYFKKNVKLCYARIANGEETILTHIYVYIGSEKSICSVYVQLSGFYQDKEFNETDVKYYFDVVDVSNKIYKKTI